MDRLRVLAQETGFFTRGDALHIGYHDLAIRRMLKARAWRRIRAGAYTFPDLWPATEEDLHRVTARAVAAKLGGAVALSHTTSASQHGLRLWNADWSVVHVTRLDGGAGRTESGVQHHEGLTLPSDVVEVDGVKTTQPARAAIEAATLLTPEAALVTLDSVLHLGKCTRASLLEQYRLMQSWPGMQGIRLPVRLADGGGQSVGESRSRFLFHAQGLPAPRTQYEVRDADSRLVGTTDFGWPELRLLGEFDGRVKYGRLLREGEEPGDAVYREKLREDELREVTGYAMVRIVWLDLSRPAVTAARIRRLMRAAA